MGPTASGKTALAIALVKRFPFEIISVDSAMVYRGMDIGTAKPDANQLSQAPHHLLNICDPHEPYSAGRFYLDVRKIIGEIHSRGKIPLLVGGTMLYFHVIQRGFSNLPSANPPIRRKIQHEIDQLGMAHLHKKLSDIDPEAAQQIHANDVQRIQRAFEVYYLTGQPLSALQKLHQFSPMPHEFINIVIAPEDRKMLHQRIADRFNQIVKNNFIDEVKKLIDRGDLTKDSPSMRTVGYRQAWAHLMGDYDQEIMREKAIAATRQLAKRQLTWLRRWEDATWFDSEDPQLFESVTRYLVSFF